MTEKSTSDHTSHGDELAGYNVSRFNATRHGILSRQVLLPWEDADAYADLVSALTEEHQPVGPSELVLVDELASAVWRKRRLRAAEASTYRRSLFEKVARPTNTAASALVMSTIEPEHASVEKTLKTSTEEEESDRRYINSHEQETDKAIELLHAGHEDAYASALELLPEDVRHSWSEQLTWEAGDYQPGDEPYIASAQSLLRFLQGQIGEWYESVHDELDARPMVRVQALGEALDPDKLERLARYETFLDRKFEKTLSTLIRLQELRFQRSREISA